MNLTAIDIETNEINYENPIPDVICMSYAGHLGEGIELLKEDFGHELSLWLSKDNSIVGHNIAFDLSLLCYQYPELWEPVFKAYDEGRVYDTMMRERLLMLTTNGDFNVLYDGHNKERIRGYALHQLEKKYLGIDRSELKESPDSPRQHFGELAGIEPTDWPKEAYQYSLDDSVNCLAIYNAQEVDRKNCISETGIDPFTVEQFRCRVAFALRLLECRGERVDPEMIKEVTKQYMDDYNAPELVDPLVKAGLLILGSPEMPYARGTKAHAEDCIHNSKHPEYKAGRKQNCECPPKMKAGTDDKTSTKELHKYIWGLAYQTDDIEAWPSEKSAFKRQTKGQKFSDEFVLASNGVIPAGVTLQVDDTWMTMFADKDPILHAWTERMKLRKIVTDYLPKLHQDNGEPAEILRCSFFALKKTGRSSSKAPSWYPGRNGQNVHPRIRPCTIPHCHGNIFISTDYSVMELATLAQKCVNLFGKSVLADKINNGDDVHAYLAAQIAVHMEVMFKIMLERHEGYDVDNPDDIFRAFMKCKGSDKNSELCVDTCDAIKSQYLAKHGKEHDAVVTWGEFYKFYRTFAKPTGLGFPGGLAPATMVGYAKSGYKIDLTLEVATQLRQIWLDTYPEMGQYLLWIKNHCRDPQHRAQYEKENGQKRLHQFYCYDTPRGMHRARADFCACANGAGLQAFAAEGALDALYQVTKAMQLSREGDILWGCYPINFIHDEILWECPECYDLDWVAGYVDKIMVDCMEKITPDVKARTESTAMRRWYKEAEATYNDEGKLIPWEPKSENEENGLTPDGEFLCKCKGEQRCELCSPQDEDFG
jgi:hypothetical protein